MDFESKLADMLRADDFIPDSTVTRVADTLQHIRQSAKSNNHKTLSSSRKSAESKRTLVLLIAAALMIICAGTVLAYTISHYDFVNAIWRDADTEQQLEQLDVYIGSGGESQKLFDYTITIEEYLTDDSGMGYIRYSVENPNGLPVMYDAHNGGSIYTSGDTEIWFEADGNGLLITDPNFCFSSGTDANVHVFIDGKTSTKTKAYFIAAVTSSNHSGSDSSLIMNFSIYDNSNEQHCIRFEFPATESIPSIEYSNSTGGVRAKLSPIGIWLYGPDFYNGYSLESLTLRLRDGYYTVIDKDSGINASKSSTVTPSGQYVIFEHPVKLDNLEKIDFNGMELNRDFAETTAFDPDAAPKHEEDIFLPNDRESLLLNTAEENPFHFRNEGGIEVFVLTADTLANCSDADIKDYVACTHGYVSYEDFLADAQEYDEHYFGREYISQNLASLPDDGIISADEIIEKYLELYNYVADHLPDSDTSIQYVTARFIYDDKAEYSPRYIWRLTNNTTILGEVIIDAATGEVLDPIIRMP